MIRILLPLVITMLITSCTAEHETTTEFTVHNTSNHTVEIRVSKFQTLAYTNIDTAFLLSPNEILTYYYIDKGKDAAYQYPFGIYSDNVHLIFDDSITMIYLKTDDSPRNILRIENYTGGKKDNDFFAFRYEITESDYQAAFEDPNIMPKP